MQWWARFKEIHNFLGNSLSHWPRCLSQRRLFFGCDASKINYNIILGWGRKRLAMKVEWGYYRFLRWEDKIKIICRELLFVYFMLFFLSPPAWRAASTGDPFQLDSNDLCMPRLSTGWCVTERLKNQLQLQLWKLEKRFQYKQKVNLVCLKESRV